MGTVGVTTGGITTSAMLIEFPLLGSDVLGSILPISFALCGSFSHVTLFGSSFPNPATELNQILKTKSPELSSVEMKSRYKLMPLSAV